MSDWKHLERGVSSWLSTFSSDRVEFRNPYQAIVGFPSSGLRSDGMLIAECGSKSYVSATADYIIEGTVTKVESRWNEARTSINTYTELAIDNYAKGVPFDEKKLTIITPGGKVGAITQWVEDQPIFHEGKRARIYLKKTNGEFSIVCAQFGVEEMLD
ncbi:hypothetical protein ACFLXL_00200 [Chloroflexota bacterium]